MMTRLDRGRAPRRERGASAVEFAIILPVLVVMLFGIIDYGCFFFDSIGLKQGNREAARQAAVLRVDTAACGTVISYDAIACTARAGSYNVLGQGSPRVKVKMSIQQSAPNTTNDWKQGNQFVVCTQVSERAVTGLVPFPANGIVTSKTVFSIEKDSSVPSGTLVSDAAPTGGNWSWC